MREAGWRADAGVGGGMRDAGVGAGCDGRRARDAGPARIRGDNGTVTVLQPTLPIWDEPLPDHRARVVARSSDRVPWLRARSRGVTGTDVARLTSSRAVSAVALEKLHGSRFGGNAYTDHGRVREPEIAKWVHATHGIHPSDLLFHAHGQPLHLATPDGLVERRGTLLLAEIKTTSSPWRSIPRSYLRQVWWQQYVVGAERTLVVWEQHRDFVPVDGEPKTRWVDRDEDEIHRLVHLADQLLQLMRGR